MKKLLTVVSAILLGVLLVTTCFAEFVVSPEHADPEIVVRVDENGNPFVGVLDSEDGENTLGADELVFITSSGEASVDRTTLSEEDAAILDEAEAKMEETYDTLKKADSIHDVFGTGTLDADREYAVTSLFDVTPIGEGAARAEEALAAGGTLSVSVKTEIPAGTPVHVAVLGEDGKWVVLDEEDVELAADGTLHITFPVLGQVAILEDIGPASEKPPVEEPASGLYLAIAIGAALILIVIIVLIVRKKKTA